MRLVWDLGKTEFLLQGMIETQRAEGYYRWWKNEQARKEQAQVEAACRQAEVAAQTPVQQNSHVLHWIMHKAAECHCAKAEETCCLLTEADRVARAEQADAWQELLRQREAERLEKEKAQPKKELPKQTAPKKVAERFPFQRR